MAEICETHISDLPDEVIFQIYSYLEEKEQFIFGQVCKRWYTITNYQPHWYRLLLHNVGIWNISKLTSRSELRDYNILTNNGSQIKAAVWDPSVISRTIFTMCSPKILAKARRLKFLRENQIEPSLISKVKTLFKKNPKEEIIIPKFIMFGPGLDTPRTSIIALKILKGRSSLFQAIHMINGGMIAMKYERQPFNIKMLYSNTKALRQPLPVERRLSSSKLFVKVSDMWVPSDPVKMACHGSSCIVYVIDATLEIENIDDPFPDLTLIIQQTYLQYQKEKLTEENVLDHPLCLLVLACVPDENSPKPDWYHLLYGLNLWKYSIPWLVCHITASNMANISIPFDWAMSHINNKQ